ncbi:MAG: PhnD/SsuA/transferrin family substrate-binding protein [Planctomycetota bacterium]
MRPRLHKLAVLALWLPALLLSWAPVHAKEPLHLIVMDPLSEPLSCDCVQGYAQRKYALLGNYLTKELGRKVVVTWHESLSEAVKETDGKFDLVIGKHSVVLHDAKELKAKVRPIARLTGKTGEVSQQGLIVVRADDAAQAVQDLAGYEVFFGPEEAEEKSAAPKKLLESSDVKLAGSKVYGACSEAAVALMKLPKDAKAAAVISSYAEPLLEGCGSIQKGDLRVLARTDDVPFITAFVKADLPKDVVAQLDESLQMVATDPKLLVGLETLVGFEPWKDDSAESKTETTSGDLKKKAALN